MKFPDATGVITWGPGPFEEHHHLELAWYAIHPIEMLFTMMGTGLRRSDPHRRRRRRRDHRPLEETASIGTVRALRPYGDYGAVVFRPKAVVQSPEKAAFQLSPAAGRDREVLPDRQAPGTQ